MFWKEGKLRLCPMLWSLQVHCISSPARAFVWQQGDTWEPAWASSHLTLKAESPSSVMKQADFLSSSGYETAGLRLGGSGNGDERHSSQIEIKTGPLCVAGHGLCQCVWEFAFGAQRLRGTPPMHLQLGQEEGRKSVVGILFLFHCSHFKSGITAV